MPINAKYAAPAMTRREAMRNLNDLADHTEKDRLPENDDTRKEWLQAIRYAIQEIGSWDDPTLANVGLLCGGGILACIALACCLTGMAYVFKGDINSSKALLPYLSRSALFSILAFLAVRAKKGRKHR